MTVSAQETVFQHVGNGVSTTFAYGCQVQRAEDLSVYVNDVLTVAGFTVNGIGSPTGGSVTFAAAPASITHIRLERVIVLERDTDYQQNGDFLARVVNPDFDRLWMAMQQHGSAINRAIKIPASDFGINTTLQPAAARANNLLSFDNNGNPVVVAPVAQSATALQILLATPAGAGMIGTVGGRTQAQRNADIPNVKDSGAVGGGVVDDTAAIDTAAALGSAIYFPDGVYLYTGDITALFNKTLFGGGSVRYAGYDYPVARRGAVNVMLAGEFRAWPMAHALSVETTQRVQIPAGVTHARLNLAAASTMSHVEGEYLEDALRVQRNATNAATDSHVVVINLTREETKALAGAACVLQFNARKGETYTGGNLAYRVQYSVEPEQPILNADGTYSNVNVNLLSSSVALALTARPAGAPFWAPFAVPTDATQVSVVFTVSFAGVAGTDDYIELEGLAVTVGTAPANILRPSFAAMMVESYGRYNATYPYGVPRGSASEQGSVSVIANLTASVPLVNWVFALCYKFPGKMICPPQLLFQSTTSGTESRLLNKNTGLNVNGIAFNLDEYGVTITNNASAGITAGDRMLAHISAQNIF